MSRLKTDLLKNLIFLLWIASDGMAIARIWSTAHLTKGAAPLINCVSFDESTDPKWYHVCWPHLTAKCIAPVVSISWASCLLTSLVSKYRLAMGPTKVCQGATGDYWCKPFDRQDALPVTKSTNEVKAVKGSRLDKRLRINVIDININHIL